MKLRKDVDKLKKKNFQNQKANFNQTWHKSCLSEGNSSFSNEGPSPFPRENN